MCHSHYGMTPAQSSHSMITIESDLFKLFRFVLSHSMTHSWYPGWYWLDSSLCAALCSHGESSLNYNSKQNLSVLDYDTHLPHWIAYIFSHKPEQLKEVWLYCYHGMRWLCRSHQRDAIVTVAHVMRGDVALWFMMIGAKCQFCIVIGDQPSCLFWWKPVKTNKSYNTLLTLCKPPQCISSLQHSHNTALNLEFICKIWLLPYWVRSKMWDGHIQIPIKISLLMVLLSTCLWACWQKKHGISLFG